MSSQILLALGKSWFTNYNVVGGRLPWALAHWVKMGMNVLVLDNWTERF